MNKLAIVLCVVLVCSCTIQAQFLNGLTSGQAFGLGLGLPFFLGGIGRGLNGGGGVGYPIPPPPRPFLLPPPMYHPITALFIFNLDEPVVILMYAIFFPKYRRRYYSVKRNDFISTGSVLSASTKMNKLAIVLCVVLVCSCTIQAQFLNGLSSGQAFGLGLGLPFFLGGIGRGLNGRGGVGYPIPPPPRPFLLPPPMYHPITGELYLIK
ncbi:Hypothetical predicted protein [Mytilus galloprovincialis]|uniref:Uncharacterized protein n=1 Tax=Mytilus galloprovincialis TaxID=29158 RepID=A0A8B6G1E0_MYTGA|nr:Hypothetical predicted protein [Mytilus galloprovincialis]